MSSFLSTFFKLIMLSLNCSSGENGADGKRTTTLSLKGIDDPKFAELYTCGFKYSETEKYVESIQVHVRGNYAVFLTIDTLSYYTAIHSSCIFMSFDKILDED